MGFVLQFLYEPPFCENPDVNWPYIMLNSFSVDGPAFKPDIEGRELTPEFEVESSVYSLEVDYQTKQFAKNPHR